MPAVVLAVLVTCKSALVTTVSTSVAEQVPETQAVLVLLFTTDEGGVIEAVLVTVACAEAAEEKSIRNSKANVASRARAVSIVSCSGCPRLGGFCGSKKRFPNYPFIRPSYTPLHTVIESIRKPWYVTKHIA